jgi:DNA polymerase (family 10)
MENSRIARLLAETADLMEIAGLDAFRIRSYRNAAEAIAGAAEPVEAVAADPARSLTSIPGVGKGIAEAILEILRRGSFARRDEMLEIYPPTALEMLKLPGIGPKTVRALWEHFRVSTLDALEQLCRDHKLREAPRMGAALEEKILRGIALYRQGAGRFLTGFAANTAAELAVGLAAAPGVEEVLVGGELRRGCETVGAVCLLAVGDGAGAAIRDPAPTDRLPVEWHAAPAARRGTAWIEVTGPESHVADLRLRARQAGVHVDDSGLPSGRTEEEVYAALGLAFIPPELRDDPGIAAEAVAGPLPPLVREADIRGDLHMHTRASDGRATLEEMAEAARARGHEYIAVTDHSKALAMANGLDERRAVEFAREVREFNKLGRGIRVFSGLECDILKDGRMDLSEDALAELDFVVASVHGHMNLEPAEMTERLLRAAESPSVRVFGHPTGRVLLYREAYRYDFDVVARAAAARGILMEINSSPERLDLGADLIRRARALGLRFTISTDAHHPRHLDNLRFGVATARRGRLSASDILNTLPAAEFAAAIGRPL